MFSVLITDFNHTEFLYFKHPVEEINNIK